MRIVCISDTHNQINTDFPIPEGDMLIHTGDLTKRGSIVELSTALQTLQARPHRHKVFIAGNHDFCFEQQPAISRVMLKEAGIVYLQDSETTIDGLRIYGTPWVPWVKDYDGWAFNCKRRQSISPMWDLIPSGLDILLTHTPPYGTRDTVERRGKADCGGCPELCEVVKRTKPRFHIFGHLHMGHGVFEREGTTYVNACICDDQNNPTQKPIVIDL